MLWEGSNEVYIMYILGSDLFLWGEWGNNGKENIMCIEIIRENLCFFLFIVMVIIYEWFFEVLYF